MDRWKAKLTAVTRPKFQTFPLRCPSYGHLQSHWTKQPVKKLNHWGKTTEDKSAKVKHSIGWEFQSLGTSRNSDRNIMQSIRIRNICPSRKWKWNQFSQFNWTSTKVIPIKKKAGYILTMSQGFKKERSSEGQAVLDIHLCSLSNNSK